MIAAADWAVVTCRRCSGFCGSTRCYNWIDACALVILKFVGFLNCVSRSQKMSGIDGVLRFKVFDFTTGQTHALKLDM